MAKLYENIFKNILELIQTLLLIIHEHCKNAVSMGLIDILETN